MAAALREMGGIVPKRTMQVNGWAMDPLHFGRHTQWGAVSRKSDRERKRKLWELAQSGVADGGPIRTESGDILNEPSGDELIPHVSSSSPLLDPDWDNDQNGQRADPSGNSSTP